VRKVPIHVIGIGLDGAIALSPAVQQIVTQAALMVGSARHLGYFPQHSAARIGLGDMGTAIAQLQHWLTDAPADAIVVILTSGDPLFFGLGRLLLQEFPAEQLTFHPHCSSVQLAFNRLKLPWQDARIISAHGRSLAELQQAVQTGVEKIAVLTDGIHTPGAIAAWLDQLNLPTRYRLWVCENLGGSEERIRELTSVEESFAPLNVVVLQRRDPDGDQPDLNDLPLLGIPDRHFLSFPDRPGLMTKREVRVQILSELALQPGQIVWDIGAGTGSVAIEVGRLCPASQVYAVEKTAIGVSLIRQNSQRFQVGNVIPMRGSAPAGLETLPDPDRIFIGGSGGHLTPILDACGLRLRFRGRIVLAIATLEHLQETLAWMRAQDWDSHLLQVQLARSIAIRASTSDRSSAQLTRFDPLNPVTLVRGSLRQEPP